MSHTSQEIDQAATRIQENFPGASRETLRQIADLLLTLSKEHPTDWARALRKFVEYMDGLAGQGIPWAVEAGQAAGRRFLPTR